MLVLYKVLFALEKIETNKFSTKAAIKEKVTENFQISFQLVYGSVVLLKREFILLIALDSEHISNTLGVLEVKNCNSECLANPDAQAGPELVCFGIVLPV